MDRNKLGRIIQNRRIALSLNQKDVAEMAGMTIKTIYAIENNKGNPTIQAFLKLLEVLGLDISIQIKTIE